MLELLEITYARAILIIVGFFIVSKIAFIIFERIFLRIARKTKTEIDDLILQAINKPVTIVLVLIGLYLGLGTLSFPFVDVALKLIVTLITIVVAYALVSVVLILIDAWAKKWLAKAEVNTGRYIVSLFHKLTKILIALLAFVYILGIWGIEITPIAAGLGVGGIVVGLALQKSLSNLFGGLAMIIDRSINPGDVIVLEDGTKGVVLDVGIRTTRIKTFDNEVIIIPSGLLAESKILNRARPDSKLRIEIPFSVAYGSEIEEVKRVVLNELRQMDILKQPEPYVRFIEMGESSLNFKAFFWIDSYEEDKILKAKDEANTRIYNALRKAGIEIPFPQLDVHLKKE